MSRYEDTQLVDAIAKSIRNGCVELFEHPYEDFPELICANVFDAIRDSGYVIVTPFEIGEEVQNAYNRGRSEAGAIL
jgi:hypothetical protein